MEGAILIGPSSNFLEHLANSPIGTPLLQSQNRNKCAPKLPAGLFSLCTLELNFGQTLWDKSEVLLGTS